MAPRSSTRRRSSVMAGTCRRWKPTMVRQCRCSAKYASIRACTSVSAGGFSMKTLRPWWRMVVAGHPAGADQGHPEGPPALVFAFALHALRSFPKGDCPDLRGRGSVPLMGSRVGDAGEALSRALHLAFELIGLALDLHLLV